jgi:phage tail sheath gpL-like
MTVDASAVARVLGVTTNFRDLRDGGVMRLPQRIAVFAQGRSSVSYSLAKFRAFSSKEVGDALGYGSPAHLAARELFPDNGDGVGTIPVTFYPLEDDQYAVTAAGMITPAGTQTKAAAYRVYVSGIPSQKFVIPAGATLAQECALIAAAINGVLHMPVIATDNTTDVSLAAKWAGASANDIYIEVVGESLGTTFTVVQMNGGLVNPLVDDALLLVGNVWETMGLNALDAYDTDALDAFQVFGEGRWGELVRKPMTVFRGNTDDTVGTSTATTSTRLDDRVNVQVPAPGSSNLPCVVAAAQLVRIAKLSNNKPANDYGSQRCPSLTPGLDSVQWDFVKRDAAVKAGSSTTEVKDGVVTISDVVTSWAPTGEAVPAYRFVCDIVKLQNIIFNLDLEFASEEWDGAPFIPDDQATVNPDAKKPRMVVAAANAIIDSLGLAAIISDPEKAKKQTRCTQDGSNPKRWNLSITVQLAGNSNVKDITLNFGFFFGTPTAIAA